MYFVSTSPIEDIKNSIFGSLWSFASSLDEAKAAGGKLAFHLCEEGTVYIYFIKKDTIKLLYTSSVPEPEMTWY